MNERDERPGASHWASVSEVSATGVKSREHWYCCLGWDTVELPDAVVLVPLEYLTRDGVLDLAFGVVHVDLLVMVQPVNAHGAMHLHLRYVQK